MQRSLFVLFFLFLAAPVFAFEVIRIDLEQGLREAEVYSQKIQVNEQNYQGALERSRSLQADNFPQLSVDGQYKLVSYLPTVRLPPPINQAFALGNRENYTTGINLTYLLADFGQTSKNLESAQAEANAEKESKNLSLQQLNLAVKKIYYQLIFQTSQLESFFDALELAKVQTKDMSKRYLVGSSSKLDYTNASKETIELKLKFLQRQAEFSSTLQDWFTITGEKILEEQLRSPLPQILAERLPEKTSLAINMVAHAGADRLHPAGNFKHSALLQLEHLKLAQKLQAESVKSSFLPRLTLVARASYDYPDIGSKEGYYQKSVFLSFVMPVFDGGKRSGQIGSFYARERSLAAQEEHLQRELVDQEKKMRQLQSQLQEQIAVAKDGVKDAETLAKLTYQSYLNGKTNYLQVQTSNLKILEWKTQVDSLLYARSLSVAQLEFLGENK